MNLSPRSNENIGGFQILVLLLSILVLVAMVADAVLRLPAEVSLILQYFDHFVCAVLFVDLSSVFAVLTVK